MTTVVRLAGATVQFRGRRASREALDRVDLSVEQGRHLAIIGPSGCGKTTLLRAVLGLVTLDAGTVEVLGQRVEPCTRPSPEAVQLVHQDTSTALNPRFTVERCIAEPLKTLRTQEDHRARVRELLGLVGLPERMASRRPGELSGGQRQRVTIARALAARPTVLLADEILSALDAVQRLATIELLRGVTEREPTTLVIVSHDLAAAQMLCDDVAVMEHGRVVEHGAGELVLRRPVHPTTRELVAAGHGP